MGKSFFVFLYIKIRAITKVKERYFLSSKCFIDDLCAINDGEEFVRFICDIHPKELELKIKFEGDYSTLLNLDTIIKKGTFIYKLFYKRDSFPF